MREWIKIDPGKLLTHSKDKSVTPILRTVYLKHMKQVTVKGYLKP